MTLFIRNRKLRRVSMFCVCVCISFVFFFFFFFFFFFSFSFLFFLIFIPPKKKNELPVGCGAFGVLRRASRLV